MITSKSKQRFHILLIKPSKYDDEGYIISWLKGVVTSNSLAALNALTLSVFETDPSLQDIEPVIHVYDETVQRIPVRRLARKVQRDGGRAIACMVGVQTNQYARAVDLATELIRRGIPSMIGGFHVSGIIEMIPDYTPEIKDALDKGITLVAGEVENRWGELMKGAYQKNLKPLYNFVSDKPNIHNTAGPTLPDNVIRSFFNHQTSFDAGRGCPFHCSFCSIINIQGNAMRGRSADIIEALVRANHARGYKHIFITDDNFARHKDWEAIADRLIELKEKENIRCSLKIQTDTVTHKIPRFIEKMTRAGVRRVFIGMESMNPENLRAAGKYQNRLSEYREMLQEWRHHGAVTYAGYIIGFPGDTYDSIMRDVAILKDEIPLDFAEFFILTPLPGSKDHQKYYLNKVPMAADTNLYDTNHLTMKHPKMLADDLMRAYHDAWESFYNKEHCYKLLLRHKGPRRRLVFSSLIWFCGAVKLNKMHPLLAGLFRRKGRKSRRSGFPIENPIFYYPKRFWELLDYTLKLLKMIWGIWQLKRKADRKENKDYMDAAITPVVKKPKPAPLQKQTVQPTPAAS